MVYKIIEFMEWAYHVSEYAHSIYSLKKQWQSGIGALFLFLYLILFNYNSFFDWNILIDNDSKMWIESLLL